MDWSELKKPSLWVAIGAVVVPGIITFFITWGRIEARLDGLEATHNRFEEHMQKALDVLQSRIDTRFDSAAAAEVAQTGSIAELQTNVMLLWCGQKRRSVTGCDVKSLVTQAKSASSSQAVYLESAAVQLNAGAKPQVASEEVKQELPQVTWGGTGTITLFPKDKTADVLLWSAAAATSRWTQEDGSIKARFANGDATFKVAPHTSREHVTRLVDSLNATTEVLKTAETSGPQK